MRIVLLGAPGVGKGTFARLLARDLGLDAPISAGDLVRGARSAALRAAADRGALAPDAAVARLVGAALARAAPRGGWVLDGFPRRAAQAAWLDADARRRPDAVVDVRLDEDVAVAKMLGRASCAACGRGFNTAGVVRDGFDMPAILPDYDAATGAARCPACGHAGALARRGDDTEAVVRRRHAAYAAEAAPVLAFYAGDARFRRFDVRRGVADAPALLETIAGVVARADDAGGDARAGRALEARPR